MLQSMREKMSGWITGVIIAVICLVFVLFGVGSYFEGGSPQSQVVAKIGDQTITENQVLNQLNRMRQTLLSQGVTDLNNPKWRKEALQGLIDQSLQVAGADNIGALVSTNQVNQFIYQVPQFMENGQFSMPLYEQFIRNSGMDTAMLRDYLSDQLVISQVTSGIAGTDFTLPSEVSSFTDLLLQKRNISYTLIKSDDFKDKVKPTDEALKSYYNEHKESYNRPAEVSIQYIQLSLDSLAKEIKIPEIEVQQYYNANKHAYQQPEQRKASQILLSLPTDATLVQKKVVEEKAKRIESELKSGESFSTLAKKYSQDVLSAKKGGDMGWLTLPDKPNKFESALFALKKEGDVSAPIQTEFGIQIIKLTEIQPEQAEAFDKAAQKITGNLKKQKAEIVYSSVGNQLANLAFENPTSLDFVAKRLNLKVETTKPFGYKGTKEGITSNKKVIEAAFSNNVLKDKNNSDIINISPTEVAVVRLNKYYPEANKPYEEVKADVLDKVTLQDELLLAKTKAKTLVQALNKGADKTQYNEKIKWQTATALERNSTRFNLDVVKSIFSNAVSSEEHPNYVSIKDGDNGILIYQITAVEMPKNTDNGSSQAYARMLQQVQSAETYKAYLAYLNKTISVERSGE